MRFQHDDAQNNRIRSPIVVAPDNDTYFVVKTRALKALSAFVIRVQLSSEDTEVIAFSRRAAITR